MIASSMLTFNSGRACLLALLCVVTVSAGTSEVTSADQFRLDHGYACQSCVGLANATSSLAASPRFQKELESSLQKHVCAKLSHNQEQQCREDVGSLVPALLPVVAQLDTTSACKSANMCGPEAAVIEEFAAAAADRRDEHASPTNSNGLPCPMCKFLLTEMLGLLESQNTEDDLMAQAHAACERVSAAERDMCNSRVDLYGRLAFLLIRDISPDGVCHLANSCPPDSQFPGQLSVPKPLLASLAALARPDLIAKSNDGECDTCKEIVGEAARMLANPEIQRQLLADAKQACEIFKTLKDQCVSYVEIYGPLAITMALGYMQPATLCSELGYCPAPLPPPSFFQLKLQAQASTV